MSIDTRFLDRLFATPRGRAFFLSFMADAEDSDERGIFDALLARIDDPRLARLVDVHKKDEVRHAQLLRARVDAIVAGSDTDARPPSIPESLRIVPFLERALGHTGERFLADRASVWEAYLFLLVVEERAVVQLPLFAAALQRIDPDSADVVAGIWSDERRHVKYALAVARRYAPSDAVLEATLARLRAAEARAFEEHGAEMIRFVLEHDLLSVGPVERLFWRALAASTTGGRRARSLVAASRARASASRADAELRT